MEMALYPISCRQMACEHGLDDVVSIIDEHNKNIWPFMKKLQRTVRLKRPLKDKLREKQEAADEERRRRYELRQKYRRSTSSQETDEEGLKDSASVNSKTSNGSQNVASNPGRCLNFKVIS